MAPAAAAGLFAESSPSTQPVEQPRVSAPQVIGTSSRLLFDVLAEVYSALGFAMVGDETFRDLEIARIVEPTSILDTGRVLTDLGQEPSSERTMRGTLARAQEHGYRDQIATASFNHALTNGDVRIAPGARPERATRHRHHDRVGAGRGRAAAAQGILRVPAARNGWSPMR